MSSESIIGNLGVAMTVGGILVLLASIAVGVISFITGNARKDDGLSYKSQFVSGALFIAFGIIFSSVCIYIGVWS